MHKDRVKMMFTGTLVNNLQDAMSVIFEAAQRNGIEIYWAANFNNYRGNITEIPCHILQTNFQRHPIMSPQNLRAIRQMEDYISQYQIQAIHCNTPIGSFCGRIAAYRAGLKAVMYTAHGLPFYSGAPRSRLLFKAIEYKLATITDIAVSMNDEDYCAFQKMNLRGDKIFKIDGVGIPIHDLTPGIRAKKRKELSISDDTTLIISVGRLEKVKQYDVCIHALSQMKNKDAVLLICGIGPEEDAIRKLAKQLDLEERVVFLGFRNDVFELLQSSDIYLLTSAYEGLPRSLMEAMNASLACVVSDARGNVDLIQNGKNGIVVARHDIYGTANALDQLSANPGLRRKYGDKASIDVLKYSAQNVIEEYTEIYRELVKLCE